MEEYGSVHAINLLGTKENETSLTSAYARHLQNARTALGDEMSITHYDFHAAARIGGIDSVVRDLRSVLSLPKLYFLKFKLWIDGLRSLATMWIDLVLRCAIPLQMNSSRTRREYS